MVVFMILTVTQLDLQTCRVFDPGGLLGIFFNLDKIATKSCFTNLACNMYSFPLRKGV